MLNVKSYQVTITMRDGSQGQHEGTYPDAHDAIGLAMELFPDAHRISALELGADGKPRRAQPSRFLKPADARRLISEQQALLDGHLQAASARPPAYAPGVVRRVARSRRRSALRILVAAASSLVIGLVSGFSYVKGWL